MNRSHGIIHFPQHRLYFFPLPQEQGSLRPGRWPTAWLPGTARARRARRLRRQGTPIPTNDLWIAAQCVEHDWTLVTDDEHFTYVAELTVETW